MFKHANENWEKLVESHGRLLRMKSNWWDFSCCLFDIEKGRCCCTCVHVGDQHTPIIFIFYSSCTATVDAEIMLLSYPCIYWSFRNVWSSIEIVLHATILFNENREEKKTDEQKNVEPIVCTVMRKILFTILVGLIR